MIASLFGTVRALKSDQLVIDVNGVGYLVHISPKSAAHLSIGRDFQIYTSMVVREDSMTLYGFISSEEKDLFELVQTVSGIGPKVALAITSAMTTEDLVHAINSKDEAAISSVPGIGKKGAQRLILELAGKFELSRFNQVATSFSWRDDLINALTGLGFTRRQSESAINELAANRDSATLSNMKESELLKLALAQMKPQKGLGK